MKKMWFIAGILSALTFGAFANFPNSGDTSGSMATASDVSEIKVKRQSELSFDSDLKRLANQQGRYRENLPLKGNKTRISTSQSGRAVKRAPKKIAPKKIPAAKTTSLKASKSRAKVS